MKRDGASSTEASVQDERAVEHARDVRCRRCDASVTRAEHAIAVEGKHAHRFVNPAGVVFDVRCFGDAPGCAPYGDPSSFFSWFRGYAWRIAVCGACGVHLGWRFEADADIFHGLIADRITEAT